MRAQPTQTATSYEGRDYETASGRPFFLNQDPIGFAGGLNWYAFADGNPVSNVDPSGLCSNSSQSLFTPNSTYSALYNPVNFSNLGNPIVQGPASGNNKVVGLVLLEETLSSERAFSNSSMTVKQWYDARIEDLNKTLPTGSIVDIKVFSGLDDIEKYVQAATVNNNKPAGVLVNLHGVFEPDGTPGGERFTNTVWMGPTRYDTTALWASVEKYLPKRFPVDYSYCDQDGSHPFNWKWNTFKGRIERSLAPASN